MAVDALLAACIAAALGLQLSPVNMPAPDNSYSVAAAAAAAAVGDGREVCGVCLDQ